MDPVTLGLYVDLGIKLEGIVANIWTSLRAAGVTDEKIAELRADYAQRIAAREAEPKD